MARAANGQLDISRAGLVDATRVRMTLRGFGLLTHGHCHGEPSCASVTVWTQISYHSTDNWARSIIDT
jgi:hypothetical protein